MTQAILLAGIIALYLALNGNTEYLQKQANWELLHQREVNVFNVYKAKGIEEKALADKVTFTQEHWNGVLDFGIRKKSPAIQEYAREHGATTPEERKKAQEDKKKQRAAVTKQPVQQPPTTGPAA